MNSLKDDAQIAKGKMQKVKGKFEERTGHPIKGAISKMEGAVNEAIGQAKKDASKDPVDDQDIL